MPEAFQPVDHLEVSRAESVAKESLKTVRQLPGMPCGPPDAGALVVLVVLGALGVLGAGADVLVGGAVGVGGTVGVDEAVLAGVDEAVLVGVDGAVLVGVDDGELGVEVEAEALGDGEEGEGRW